MQERQVSVGNATRPLPQPFFVLATQNPLEMEGTYVLPEAQLDRFIFKVQVPFPEAQDLKQILQRTIRIAGAHAEKVIDGSEVQEMMAVVREVPVAEHLVDWAVQLILATHPDNEDAPAKVKKYVRYGASPRGLQALVIAAQVRALLEGRYNVALDDLREVAHPALRHRVVLNFEGQAEGLSTDGMLDEIIAGLPVKAG
jgi:MoxR-like ATPase